MYSGDDVERTAWISSKLCHSTLSNRPLSPVFYAALLTYSASFQKKIISIFEIPVKLRLVPKCPISVNQALAGLPVALFAIIYRLPTIRGVGVVQSTVDYATASFEDCNPSGWRERIHPPQVQFL